MRYDWGYASCYTLSLHYIALFFDPRRRPLRRVGTQAIAAIRVFRAPPDGVVTLTDVTDAVQ